MKKFLFGAMAFALALSPLVAFAQELNPTPGVSSIPSVSEKTSVNRLSDQVNPATRWTYAGAAGGITDTTGVAFKAAAGAGKKIYVRGIQFSNSGAGTSEFAINCGASGTALWRGFVQATAATQTVNFTVPLQCTANTLLEVKLVTGTTMLFRFNAQGYTD